MRSWPASSTEELDARLDDVDVLLEDARPELLFNQLTGGSNTIHALYGPLRAAAAHARARLLTAAVRRWGVAAGALTLGPPADRVTVHVVRGGGSSGRRLFFDPALEAARVSRAVGRPVRLLWTRADDMRHGRMRPATTGSERPTSSARW